MHKKIILLIIILFFPFICFSQEDGEPYIVIKDINISQTTKNINVTIKNTGETLNYQKTLWVYAKDLDTGKLFAKMLVGIKQNTEKTIILDDQWRVNEEDSLVEDKEDGIYRLKVWTDNSTVEKELNLIKTGELSLEILNIEVDNNFDEGDKVILSWETNILSTSTIRYSVQGTGKDIYIDIEDKGKTHIYEIESLKPFTKYTYVIFSYADNLYANTGYKWFATGGSKSLDANNYIKKCEDTDEGRDIYNSGYVSGGIYEDLGYVHDNLEDKCNSISTLTEFYCEEETDKVIWERIECTNGCRDNVCIEKVFKECSDTDSELDRLNYYEKGTVTAINEDGSIETKSDYCEENKLKEIYCKKTPEGYVYREYPFKCKDGCKDGYCIKEDEENNNINIEEEIESIRNDDCYLKFNSTNIDKECVKSENKICDKDEYDIKNERDIKSITINEDKEILNIVIEYYDDISSAGQFIYFSAEGSAADTLIRAYPSEYTLNWETQPGFYGTEKYKSKPYYIDNKYSICFLKNLLFDKPYNSFNLWVVRDTSQYDPDARETVPDEGKFYYELELITRQNIPERLKGKIILKVESAGEAYYIHPDKEEMYYLGRPDDAFSVMREQGVGITNSNLEKIPVGLENLTGLDTDGDGLSDLFEDAISTNKNNKDSDGDGYNDKQELEAGYNPRATGKLNYNYTFTNLQKGKIFLQVERNGEAWYINPDDGKRYFLGRPADAFQVMRNLGLGISNNDFDSL